MNSNFVMISTIHRPSFTCSSTSRTHFTCIRMHSTDANLFSFFGYISSLFLLFFTQTENLSKPDTHVSDFKWTLLHFPGSRPLLGIKHGAASRHVTGRNPSEKKKKEEKALLPSTNSGHVLSDPGTPFTWSTYTIARTLPTSRSRQFCCLCPRPFFFLTFPQLPPKRAGSTAHI